MGDMNDNNTAYERAKKDAVPGMRMARGLELCTTFNLVVGGTLFPHRDIQKLTWYSPSGKDSNQIDHLMITRTWRRSLLGVKVK